MDTKTRDTPAPVGTPPTWSDASQCCALGIGYFCLTAAGALLQQPGSIGLAWFANSVAIAMLASHPRLRSVRALLVLAVAGLLAHRACG